MKPHASPVFHAIQYLFGHQTQEKLERFHYTPGSFLFEADKGDGFPAGPGA